MALPTNPICARIIKRHHSAIVQVSKQFVQMQSQKLLRRAWTEGIRLSCRSKRLRTLPSSTACADHIDELAGRNLRRIQMLEMITRPDSM